MWVFVMTKHLYAHIQTALALALLSALVAGCAVASKSNPPPATQFVPFQHVAGNSNGEQEHDAVFYPDGERDFYPSQQNPRRVRIHPTTGGTIDSLCMNDDCTEFVVRTQGLKDIKAACFMSVPTKPVGAASESQPLDVCGLAAEVEGSQDGSFEYMPLDSRIALVRDGTTEKNVGYIADDERGNFVVMHTLEEAHAVEYPPESKTSAVLTTAGSDTAATLKTVGSGTVATLKAVGKVTLGALIVTAVVAGALAQGMADARANRQTVYVASPSPTFTNCSELGTSLYCTTY